MASKWSALFYEYYSHNIHPDIHAIARRAIEPYGVHDPYSRGTSSQAVGLNYVLKQLLEWHESPVDCMVLTLYYLQGYYIVEIRRAEQGLGKYHLHSKFSPMVQIQPPLISEQNTYLPEDIVGQMKVPEPLCHPTSCPELAREEQQTNQPTDPIGRSKTE